MKTIALFFGALALVFSLPVGQEAFAENSGNRTVTIEPFEFDIDSPCNPDEPGEGEDINITGLIKTEEISISTPSGTNEISLFRMTGTGTGTGEETGASYRVQVVMTEYEIELGQSEAEIESEVFMLRVSSPTAPNFVILLKGVETPTGRDFQIEHAVCQGEGPVPVDV